ncbi:OsmC-like protein [Nocardioides sp. J9]|uniref:OsmC family protein n=1 Tax=unclassified Nocardioides TaxID=2615069 RepID=UPI00049017E8|nr:MULTISPECIES: OsmC family protein [unclassified Nocardioides]TWH03209.1 OsmC-like protein [Nocardioides sp. J9]
MADAAFGVRAASGTLRGEGPGVELPHAWSPEGVLAGPVTNGAQALHLSVALCVLNDVHREARELGIPVEGVAVSADGGFDQAWASTGISYSVVVDSEASAEAVDQLLAVVDEVAEVPRALRAGAAVRRVEP